MNDDRETTDLEETGGAEALRIEAEIAQTRQEMTGTVEAIGDRLSPSNILDEAKHTVREATVGKVEDMTSTAAESLSGAGSTIQETGSGILETIKQNPVPAAIAGIGIAWLWTHRAQGSKSGYGSSFRQDAWDTGYNGARGPQDSMSEGIGDKLGDAVDTVGRRVSGVGDAVAGVPSHVGGGAETVTRQAQRLIEESPLAVGAAALAIGAALGMVLPGTQIERNVLGPAAGQMIGTVEGTATEALQKVQEEIPV